MTYTVFNFQRALVKEFNSPNHILNCCPPGTENTTAAQIASALAHYPSLAPGSVTTPTELLAPFRKCILTRFRVHVNPKFLTAAASRFGGRSALFWSQNASILACQRRTKAHAALTSSALRRPRDWVRDGESLDRLANYNTHNPRCQITGFFNFSPASPTHPAHRHSLRISH